MLWHTPILRTIPISEGTSSQMGKKQAMRSTVKAGVTATPRATLLYWLNIHSNSLVVCSSPCASNLLHQLHSTPGTVTPTILFSVSLVLSVLFLFVFLKWLLHHQGTTCLLSKCNLHSLQTHSAVFLCLWAFLGQGVQCLLGRALYFLSLRHWCNNLPS